MKHVVVAIDGPGGAGKSTVSRTLARELGYQYVDTGAMYRVIGVLAAERSIRVDDDAGLAALCDSTSIAFEERDGRVCVTADGRDLSGTIRTAEAAQHASRYSTVPVVREHLVAQQRRIGATGDVVMEGRDIGTVVFPDALVKVYLEASPRERACRRAADIYGKGATEAEISRIEKEIAERDARDSGRAHSPLRPAADAIVFDTTNMAIEDVVDSLRTLIIERVRGLARST